MSGSELADHNDALENSTIENLVDRFEEAGHEADQGDKRWFARDLAALLGYTKWENFSAVITRAKDACAQAGNNCADHFPDVRKMIPIGKGGSRAVEDVELSRYAAYLVAQNADARKRPVAIAQTYFAIQTRRQELTDRNGPDFSSLSETQQRLYLRNQVVQENKKLASTAQDAGVHSGKDHAIFNNKGYQGLYGGRRMDEVREYKGLPAKAKILDHMGSTELAANLFRITQTEEKLRSRGIVRKEHAFEAHFEVGRKVRQTMLELSGILPENLPVAEDVKRLATSERKAQKALAAITPEEFDIPVECPPDFTSIRSAPVSIDPRTDLWKYALLIMSVRPDGVISTTDLIADLPNYVQLSDDQMALNASRKDSRFSQIVRNLKSHKDSKTNFIYRGFAEDVPHGFRITNRGLAFVQAYFADRVPGSVEEQQDRDQLVWVSQSVGLTVEEMAELEWELESIESGEGATLGYMVVFASNSDKRLLKKVRGLSPGFTVQVGFPPDYGR